MKTTYILSVSAALLLLAGCNVQETEFNPETGQGGLMVILEEPATRISIDESGAIGKLTWNKGDEIAVFAGGSYKKGTLSQATTSTRGVIDDPDGVVVGERNNYAIYPYRDRDESTYGQAGTVNVILPDSYDISDIVAGTSTTRTYDYSPMPMIAVNSQADSYLRFYHVGGLLRIICNDIPAGTSTLNVTMEKPITGIYSVIDPETTTPVIVTPGASSDNTPTIVYTIAGASGLEAETDGIILNVPVPCGTYNWIRVDACNAAGEVLYAMMSKVPHTFLRRHGYKLPIEEAVPFDYYVEGLEGSIEGLKNNFTDYAGAYMNLADNFKSYKSDGTQSLPVPFKLQYSLDEGATWSDGLPSWLIPQDIDYSGSTDGMELPVFCEPLRNTRDDSHHNTLIESSRRKTNFDLSTYNVGTGAEGIARTTANTYVVRGAGTYKLPLVYGNAVKNGAVNESAFRARAGRTGSWRPDVGDTVYGTEYVRVGQVLTDEVMGVYEYHYFGYFRDHLDNYIKSPYLTTQLGKAAGDFTPALIWTDVPGLIDPTTMYISGEGENTYLNFEVPEAYIAQGNAVIAVVVDGTIAWSWQIWVTDADLTFTYSGAAGYQFMRSYLGWCDGSEYAYTRRSCRIRAVQTEDGGVISESYTMTQAGKSAYILRGNAPMYQWGRKDPILGSGSADQTFIKPGYNYSAFSHYFSEGRAENYIAIQNPHFFYSNDANIPHDWCLTTYLNYWNSTLDGWTYNQYSAQVTKTVYDPSPVGYKIPPQVAFTHFIEGNLADPKTFYYVENTGGAKGNDGYLNTVTNHFIPNVSYRSPYSFPPIHEAFRIGIWSAVPESRSFGWDMNCDKTRLLKEQVWDYRDDGRAVMPVLDND